MALKRKTKVENAFSMASMTDVIFLLLIFFLVTSTIVVPNVIKVSLPSATASQQEVKQAARLIISSEGTYYLSLDKSPEQMYSLDSIETMLGVYAAEHTDAYLTIRADETVPYSSVVRGISVANKVRLKVVLATKIDSK